MIISRVQVDRVLRAHLQAAAQPPSRPTVAEASDSVRISADSQRIQALIERTRQLPDVRPERVAELTAAIAEGRYHVSPEEVAATWLERLLADTLLEGRG